MVFLLKSLFPIIQLTTYVGFPRLERFGSIDEDLGFIAMELLGPNSLEVLRKIECKKHKDKQYGLPMASVVAIATKLVRFIQVYSLDHESQRHA